MKDYCRQKSTTFVQTYTFDEIDAKLRNHEPKMVTSAAVKNNQPVT